MKQVITVNGIIEKDGRVLLAKRSDKKRVAPGKYHLPGGHVDYGEEPADALAREFAEEFGITVRVGSVIHVFSYTHDDIHAVGIAYALDTDAIPADIHPITDENDTVAWVGHSEIDSYLEKSDHNYAILQQYFATQQ